MISAEHLRNNAKKPFESPNKRRVNPKISVLAAMALNGP